MYCAKRKSIVQKYINCKIHINTQNNTNNSESVKKDMLYTVMHWNGKKKE